MFNWKLTSNLTNPESSEWEELSKKCLGNEVHADRKMGFLLSRNALQMSLKEMGFEVSIPELVLMNHDKVVNFPQLTISLSHTKDCGAALIAERKVFRSVGIDIEEETRTVKESIKQRISHPSDISLRNIELWCVKEAVFKSIMNTGLFEKPIEFGSIELKTGEWIHSPTGLKGTWETKLASPYLVAFAFLKN